MFRLLSTARPRPTFLLPLLVALGCTAYQPFDSTVALRGKFAERLPEGAERVEVPFALDRALQKLAGEKIRVASGEESKVAAVLDFIFGTIRLKYSLTPTRNAVGTFLAREGNCLSFVNLFVGIARQVRLAPFYLEVTDLQRWSYEHGMVVSQGHIVAGMYVGGKLRTYDFLPYRAKSYREFQPIDDLTATAHYYNNLGAEALLRGDLASARALLTVATRLVPTFVKGLNNLGIVFAREGETELAEQAYGRAMEIEPDSLPVLTNLARLYLEEGRRDAAQGLLARLDVAENTNPFYFVFRGDEALARGDTNEALGFMVKALRLESELPEVHLGLVRVFVAVGDLKRARYHLERALKLDATNREALKYAELLRESDRGARADAPPDG